MDVRCSKCGEPWDIDTFHDVAEETGSTFDAVRQAFYADGCAAVGSRHGDAVAHPALAVLQELSGDDVDGLAADLEDFEAMGLI